MLAEWQKTLFLRNKSPDTRGWLLDVMKCVESLGKRDFTLNEVYAFERHLGELYPGNQNIDPRYASSFSICATADLLISSRGRYDRFAVLARDGFRSKRSCRRLISPVILAERSDRIVRWIAGEEFGSSTRS